MADTRKILPVPEEERESTLERYFRIARTQGREALRKQLEKEIAEREFQETESENN